MTHPTQQEVTRMLKELEGGNRDVINQLFPLIYESLHAQAQAQRRRWHGDYTLNTTALVHEAYIKLVDQEEAVYQDHAHFLAVAARAMRHILVDYAKGRSREKRGGNIQKVSLEDVFEQAAGGIAWSDEQDDTVVALDEALARLARISERQAKIVECRFFGGMTVEETAVALDISPATVKRGWAMAQAWLFSQMQQGAQN